MADRRPLVVINGVVMELAAPDKVHADVLPAAGGSGSAARSFFLS